MGATLFLSIISSDKIIYSADVLSAVVPAEFGYMGILANHAPIVAHLVKGRITVRENLQAKEMIFELGDSGGFLEVFGNKATVVI